MKIGYVDCFSGISGDMFLGALLDAGLSIEHLRTELAKLNLPDVYRIGFKAVQKGAIMAGLFEVDIEGLESAGSMSSETSPQPHSHAHPHEHAHSMIMPAHSHSHELASTEPVEDHEHHHRNMRDISELIEASTLSPQVKATSLAIFRRLAEAEGKIHGEPAEEVRFHEVGAVDSILDIVGAAIGLEALGIERLYASALPLGSGKVKTQHGLLPLPAPATLELLRQAQIPVVPSPAEKELVTPTGAAILASLATFEQPAMRIIGVGTGAGRRDLAWPNVLRLIVGETNAGASHGELVLIETNIDDMSAQAFGQVMTRLFAAGALDVYFTPIFMKKNRPATMLSIIASRLHEPSMARILLEETTTFGMRIQPIGRYEAQREMRKVQTVYGEIDIKIKLLDGKVLQAIPEYDTCLRIADEKGEPFLDVYQSALAAGRSLVEK